LELGWEVFEVVAEVAGAEGEWGDGEGGSGWGEEGGVEVPDRTGDEMF
jgi:hypothetical protein